MLKIKSKSKIIRKLGSLISITKKNSNLRKKLPGEHGILSINKINNLTITDDFYEKLKEKQKLRYYYLISENNLFLYYKKAKQLNGLLINNLIQILESRLDNIIFRLGFAKSILFAKQLINHNHILVNNKKINISSYLCKKNDIISIKNNVKSKDLIKKNYNNNIKIPSYLDFNKNLFIAKYNGNVDIKNILYKINFSKINEYYSL
jgi:small subunit ribosomal protein S4